MTLNLTLTLPDATHLALGFDWRSSFSPGTAKTSVEGLAQGGKARRDGKIVSVPLAYRVRRIDFGAGEKLAMTIPWGEACNARGERKVARVHTANVYSLTIDAASAVVVYLFQTRMPGSA